MEGLQNVWGWQPALYLFLGGMGASAFIAAMVVYFKAGQRKSTTVFVSVVAAVGCLAAGLLLLLSELITPMRGLMMWQSFSNFSSWMTIGAWIVFAAVVVFALEALLVWERGVEVLSERSATFAKMASKLARVFGIVGCILGLAVAVYTGILLMSAPGVPLWNTLFIPCLFTISALDTGIALVEIVMFVRRGKGEFDEGVSRFFNRCVVALVVIEFMVLIGLLVSMLMAPVETSHVATIAAQSAVIIVQGNLAVVFWALVVIVGLVLPLVASLVAMRNAAGEAHIISLVGAVGALIGGCALRFVILLAGIHADPVIDAVARLMG